MKRSLKKPKQNAFLRAYAVTANITQSAKLAKISRDTHYEWLASDQAYPQLFERATDEAVELLEAEVWESATKGIEEPVIYQGQLCYIPMRDKKTGEILRTDEGAIRYSKKPLTVRKRNDVAAFFLLKALRPDKYRENSKVEVTGSLDIVDRLAAARQRLKKRDEDKDK